ncbi:MAG: AmmeMemoRadiSam system protein A [Sulfuricurvum sp.]|uniref:AmmeMemoRadiSam system protein A n=1 Tax=Sulfuricurvum sp. TaxID=2025608 RepID=UPI00262098E3|nr:AmmeMemoRadiSam system protein A [Sulfuricurvum sp.]MDD2829024.1 AmmeMemoRadiSam system protein A [Sulfuricurvum sp.]MDD4949671.1 AmmeMemoRadiSam system protein A [Sulfuricurvum sp.]
MDGSLYLMIAREAILTVFQNSEIDTKALQQVYPELSHHQATFVTLTINGRLRGCIGSLIAHRSLIDDLISNARSAALRDPRFTPLTPNEFGEIMIEVSLLTHPQLLTYADKEELKRLIRPNIDGVILLLGNHQATFLPQVWEELEHFDSFFDHLGHKAGIGSDPLSYHPEISVYQVKKFKEQVNE